MQKKPDQTLTVQTDTIRKDTVQRERKEPITIENLPGIDAIPVVMFVVSKAGYPCHVAIRRSANVFISDIQTAQKIDSIACKLVQDLPRFTPASLDGELVNHRMVVAVRFK